MKPGGCVPGQFISYWTKLIMGSLLTNELFSIGGKLEQFIYLIPWTLRMIQSLVFQLRIHGGLVVFGKNYYMKDRIMDNLHLLN